MNISRKQALSILLALFLVIGLGTVGGPAHATVNLARQYHAPCSMCHTVYPQLNRFGRAFYENGLRLPDNEAKSALAFRHNIPFSFSTRASLNYDPQREGRKFQTGWDDLQLHGSGLLTKQDSFYLHHHIFEFSRGGDIYEAWLQHSFGGASHVNVQVGQFAQPLAFSPEIQRLTYSEYVVYTMAVGLDDFTFANRARGVSLTGGSLHDGLRYTFSVNQPRRETSDVESSSADTSTPSLLFTSPIFANIFARGQYQIKGKRFGLFADMGQTNLFTSQGRATDHFARYGIDAEAQGGKARFYGLWLTGTNNNPVGTGQHGSLNGGFVGADYQFAPRYMTYLRYDHATSRSPLGKDQEQGPTAGIVGQITPTWQFQMEYQHRQEASNQWTFSSRYAF